VLSRDPCYPWEKKPTNSTDHADNTDAFVIFDPEFSKKAGGNVFFCNWLSEFRISNVDVDGPAGFWLRPQPRRVIRG